LLLPCPLSHPWCCRRCCWRTTAWDRPECKGGEKYIHFITATT
jgi:hypothetical protein